MSYIKKAKKTQNFTIISNEAIQNQSLTWEARGLLSFILSLPEDWKIHKTWLIKSAANCGRDKLDRIIKELKSFGYMVSRPTRDEQGKINGHFWEVFEEPSQVPEPAQDKPAKPVNTGDSPATLETRSTGKPCSGEPATTKYLSLQSTNLNKTTTTEETEKTFDFNSYRCLVDGSKDVLKAPEWALNAVFNYCEVNGLIMGASFDLEREWGKFCVFNLLAGNGEVERVRAQALFFRWLSKSVNQFKDA